MDEDRYYTFNTCMNVNELSASEEDYLEMIYRLCQINEGFTRVNDIAHVLHVKPPSVTKMIKKLQEAGIIDYKRYGRIRLTEKGAEMGKFLLYRHNTVKSFLRLINIKDDLHQETEKMEHTLSETTLEGLKNLTNFFNSHPEVFKLYKLEKG